MRDNEWVEAFEGARQVVVISLFLCVLYMGRGIKNDFALLVGTL